MKALRLIAMGIALALLLVYLGRGFGADFLVVGLRGLAVVAALPFLLILVSHSPSELGRAFADVFSCDKENLPEPRLVDGSIIFAAMGRYALAAGVMGTFWACCAGINAIAMSRGVPEHPASFLAPWIAQALFMPAAGCFLRWFIFAPLSETLRPANT